MTTTGDTWRLGHRPALDELRGVAVALVVLGHAFEPVLGRGAFVGVSIFFALSGFLITALLLEELERRGRVDLRAFYLRRARRLLPALLVFLAAAVAAGISIDRAFGDPRQAVMVTFYVANFWHGPMTGLGHMWSLSVEEQFYLVWPVMLLLALRRGDRQRLLTLAMVGLAVSWALRLALWDPTFADLAYHGTVTNAGALLLGCALAAVLVGRPVRQRRAGAVASCALLSLVALSLLPRFAEAQLLLPMAAPTLAVIVIAALAVGRPRRWSCPTLALIGRRSYALYLWHFPLLCIVAPRLDLNFAWKVALIGASWCLALASWRYVEAPFLARGRSLTRRLAAPGTAGPAWPSRATG